MTNKKLKIEHDFPTPKHAEHIKPHQTRFIINYMPYIFENRKTIFYNRRLWKHNIDSNKRSGIAKVEGIYISYTVSRIWRGKNVSDISDFHERRIAFCILYRNNAHNATKAHENGKK